MGYTFNVNVCRMPHCPLKEQEPVEPKQIEFEDTGLTWQKYNVPVCGVCESLLGDTLYCPQCGTRVKWE